jgi:hypothetical protein
MKLHFAPVLALLLAACATNPPPEPPPPPSEHVVRPPPPRQPQANPDSCGARDLQYLIGRNRTEIPVPLYPNRRRVVCTTCPMTMDYSPLRQTITFDAETGIIREIKCG